MKHILMITAFAYSNSICVTPILNNPTRICKNCVHYNANKETCELFFKVDMVTGDKTYEYASIVRNSETKCGNDAKYYLENNLKYITVPYYFVKERYYLFLLACLWVYSALHSTNTQVDTP